MRRTFIGIAVTMLLANILLEGAFPQPSSPAISGQVSSKEEGLMEGVLVSARRAGSTITMTVATDRRGKFIFPRRRVDPGEYSLTIRAVGYEMSPAKIVVTPASTAKADLVLRKAQDVSLQLSNAEWLTSIPGSDEQKSVLLECTTCHTLQRILRSHHNASEFMQVMNRMSGYYPGASPLLPQRLPGNDSNPGNPERFRKPSEFLSTINLSSASKWEYPLKMLRRPKGKATRMIVTEFDLPRKESQPHDVVVDSQGMAWYYDFGQQYLGKLDPVTGRVKEYPVPELKPGFPRGGLEVELDNKGNVWVGLQFQGGIAKFDPKTEKFQMFPLPQEVNNNRSQVSMVMPGHADVDGKVWMKNAGSVKSIHRVDLISGKFEFFNPFPDDLEGGRELGMVTNGNRHVAYGISADSRNNVYFMDLRGDYIGRLDAKTGEVKHFATPTTDSGPRRGHVDSQDRLWFAEYRGNKISMFDTRTEKFQEWAIPTPWTNPYDAVADKNGEAWSGGMSSDRIARLNPKTGEVTEYLLPQETNVRRVFVDDSTTPVTFWAGNDHHASIIKLEPLDE